MGWDRILGWFGWGGRNKPLDPAGAQHARRLEQRELDHRARQTQQLVTGKPQKPTLKRRMMHCQRF